MSYQKAADANFFALVHHVLEAGKQEQGSAAERRLVERKNFASLQYIAPYRDGQSPLTEFDGNLSASSVRTAS